jgi:hypothetical protein
MAKDIKGVFEPSDILEYLYNEYLLSPWKEAKILWNPATHARNVTGNFIFADFAEVQPWRLENMNYYKQGFKELQNPKGSVYRNLIKYNAIGTEYYGSDIKAIENEIAKGSSLPKAISSIASGFQKTRGIAGKVFALEDQIYKAAAYMKYTSECVNRLGAHRFLPLQTKH